jgi:hypothetical protein
MTANADRECVRSLATEVARIAHAPRAERIRARWRAVNGLRKPDRAPVWCRPVGCWKEILPGSCLTCQEPWLRGLEYQFRQILVKEDIGDDSPVEPRFTVSTAWRRDPLNTWGVDIRRTRSDATDGAWAYDPPLVSAADFDRLCPPRFTVDREATDRQLNLMGELVGDIMPVELTTSPPLGATLGNPAADLRGLEQMMVDMIDAPELMHRLMGLICDATQAGIDAAEASGMLTHNNTGPMTCSDPLPTRTAAETLSCSSLWCMANSQEFDQVSPAMWEEFCLQYQKKIFSRFGLVGYGCCENLTEKLNGVLSIPNLRIFVCSAWTDLEKVLERVGTDYCIMWRQKASDVTLPDDDQRIQRDLEEGARRLQGSHYQIVLRELQTLAGHPDRLHVWTRYAREAAARFA